MLTGRCNALPKEGPKEIYKKKRQKQTRDENISSILSFIYLVNGLTNATSQDTAWCPKTPDSKIGVVGSTSLPEKRGRFTENLSIYLSSPAPNSPLQNPSNFGATASHWPLYILLFFFFLILTGWMRGALCVATRLYILYLAADESISGWEFLLLIPKSPHRIVGALWDVAARTCSILLLTFLYNCRLASSPTV